MSEINELLSINQPIHTEKKLEQRTDGDQKKVESISFSDTIRDFLTAVSNNQKKATGKVTDVIQGKSENLAEAMVTLEEAGLSFQLMLEIRNKLLESYKEIQRMQV